MSDFIPQIRLKTNEDQSKDTDLKTERGSVDTLVIPKLSRFNKLDRNEKRKFNKAGWQRKFSFSLTKRNKKILSIVGVLSVILFVLSSLALVAGYGVYKKAINLEESVKRLTDAGRQQNLVKIKSELQNTKDALNNFESAYVRITWLKPFPIIGKYVDDGKHGIKAAKHGFEAADILLETVEPYADILGFTNDGESKEAISGEQTAKDRLDFVIKSIPDVLPRVNELSEKVVLIQEEVGYIDPNDYPKKIKGVELRSKLKKGIELVDMASDLVVDGKPLLEAAPYILGTEDERTYLVLFQNDKELRPTGGFMTAYSIAKVSKGKFEPVSSSDMYNLDSQYFPTTAAPEPIIKYLKGPYLISKKLRLRDMNWSPDFYESTKLFLEEAKSAGIKDIDGIIAVDTQLLVYILDAMGPIGVPGYGEYSTTHLGECDCPQVIYELESFADIEGPIVWSENEPGKIVFAPPNYDNRKKIIGPLMNSILSNALGQSKEKIPALFEAGMKSLLEKHVLFYMINEDAQKGVESFGIAGRIEGYDGDYLHINDANLGGRKSNLYVTQEVNQEIEIANDGSVEKTLTITYKNPKEHDGWLNSVLPNWVRIYVPKGSELIDFAGVEEKAEPYEDLGKTVFAGFFELRPEGIAKVTVTYKLPFKVDDEYRLLIQKQPGTDLPLYSISSDKFEEELFLDTDKEFKFSL